MEQQTEQYCRKVRVSLQCPSADAKRCIADVRRTAERLRWEEPEISWEEIEEFLGEPEDVARTFLDTLEPAQVARYRNRCKLFFGLLVGGLTLLLLTGFCMAFYYFVTPQMTYEEVFYSSEPIELSPDDPRAKCLYE